MNQDWFEMNDLRNSTLKSTVWIPLRTSNRIVEGEYGFSNYKEEFFGLGSVAIHLENQAAADNLSWSDVGIGHDHSGYYQDDVYTPADKFQKMGNEVSGVHLVLEQRGNQAEKNQWHLNQDFTITLGLMREGDIWVSQDEGYIEVARLNKDQDGIPIQLEVRAEHLKDYLCARKMSLFITSYFSRIAIVEDASFISWESNDVKASTGDSDRWEGRLMEIHEGGYRFGKKMAVFHVSRTDVDGTEDIPDISGIPSDDNTAISKTERGHKGRKLYQLIGALWKTEWIDPAKYSPRIRGDELPSTIFFIIDEEGKRESKDTLAGGGKWLWFKPDVIMALAHSRGGALSWYTRDTGTVRCSPDYGIPFGINSLGLINAYAKDIVLLPEWQQQIWAGNNISPEGGVSEELIASQVKATPAGTQAPEKYLYRGIELVNEISKRKLGIQLFRDHEAMPELISRVHRFRAVDEAGLYALANDVARMTADSLDTNAMQTIVPTPEETSWGSLRTLENLLAAKIPPEFARSMTSAMVGAYELRHADAHLPKNDIEDAFSLLEVDRSMNTIFQAYQMLHSCTSSIYRIAKALNE